MKTLTQYMNAKGSISEASDSVDMSKASKNIMNLMEEYNSINENIMKSYVEAVQNHIKKGSSRNVNAQIQKWMKKHGKDWDSELSFREYNKLVDFVILECWGLSSNDTVFVDLCKSFRVDKSSVDELDRKFMQARMNAFKKIFG